MKNINIGIVGLGTVGGGAVQALIEKRKMIEAKTGFSLNLLKVFDKDATKVKSLKLLKSKKAKSVNEVLDNDEIDIVVELIGGVHPAREIILKAIANGKHVVTANKALLAECGNEIFTKALKEGRCVGFEASVCGAIPIIKTLKQSFAANKISALYGIVNGTSNFVLSKMAEDDYSLKKALSEAKKRGIAESDPTVDLEGIDSSHKLAILATLCFGGIIKLKDIYVEGIKQVEAQDIVYARAWGHDVKLLAIAKKHGNSLQLRVHPTLIPLKHLLSNVKYEDNAVFVKGDMIGESMLYGKGAGRMPAASSVLSDIVDIARKVNSLGVESACASDNLWVKKEELNKISQIGDLMSRYYIRISAIDRPGVLAGVSTILAKNGISIANVSQKERKKDQVVPIAMFTHDAKESSMMRALKAIDKLSYIKKKSVRIRMER
ncbi:MAG: homoserine dehydrogenase [Candidatus Omnitrophica bacterium]|nr:homoserine dehydrogenase [Candidatus Omnitrophota bacterium]